MAAFKTRFKHLADRIDVLSVRERGLIFFAVVAVLYVFAYNVIFAPLLAEQTRLQRELHAKHVQIQASDGRINDLLAHGGTDVNAENRKKLAALKEQIRRLDERMNQMTSGVVPPKEMAKLVEQMLVRNKNLELVKLEALAPKPLGGDPKAGAGARVPTPGVTIYRHGMRIEFKGRYFDIVNYLKSLEGLPWKVFWGKVSLETDKYPVSKVSLVIYTLSRYPGWIGV